MPVDSQLKKGDYLNTYSGIRFYPLDPASEDIKMIDIAHALSLTCRFNGHCKSFYSVAQHSLFCATEAQLRGYSPVVQLACLLHDASEAYISDITRPVKKYLSEYKQIEKNIQDAILRTYGVPELTCEAEAIIKMIDDAMLGYEGKILLGDNFYKSQYELEGEYDLSFRDMSEVRDEFVITANSLIA